MAQAEGRAGRQGAAGRYTWAWMVVAVLMVGGFMAWLAATSEPTTVAVVEEGDEEAGGAGGALTITLNDLAGDVSGLQGRDVRLAEVRVASRMGAQAVWIELPNGPYLVKLRPEVTAGGFSVQPNALVSVTGRIVAMSDSVLTAWEQEGAIADENQRAEAQYAQTFLEASAAESGGTGAGSE